MRNKKIVVSCLGFKVNTGNCKIQVVFFHMYINEAEPTHSRILIPHFEISLQLAPEASILLNPLANNYRGTTAAA